jgi:hypothetical protein
MFMEPMATFLVKNESNRSALNRRLLRIDGDQTSPRGSSPAEACHWWCGWKLVSGSIVFGRAIGYAGTQPVASSLCIKRQSSELGYL